MNEHLQRITALLAQACATHPGGKRGVFKAIEASEGKSLSESSFYAALNSNPTAPDTLKVSQLISVMRVTADVSPLRYMAAMFNSVLTSLDAVSPDSETLNDEIIQDYPCLVAFHRACKEFREGNGSMEAVLATYEALSLDIKETVKKTLGRL